MSPRPRINQIRRIVVAIDASSHSLAGLEAAVGLASRLDADLAGLFIEDINLLRLGELPISNQVGRYSAKRQKITGDEIRRQLSTQSRWAFEALEMLSNQSNLRWSFNVAQGAILPELAKAAEEADLIILGKTGWSDTRLIGSTTRAILTEHGNLTLILREGVKLGETMMILYDGSAASKKALDVVGQISDAAEGQLVVMLVAEDRPASDRLAEEVGHWNEGRNYPLVFLWTPDTHPLIVCSIARTEESGILVIPQGNNLFTNVELVNVLNDINCPVLFVGNSP